MKKFQNLKEDLFNDQKLSKETLGKIYGGLIETEGVTIDNGTHQATGPETNHDAVDNDKTKVPDIPKKQ